MSNNKLNVIAAVNNKEDEQSKQRERIPSPRARIKEMQAKFERLWLLCPERFNPLRNALQRERLDRSFNLIQDFTSFEGKTAVDLGSAAGVFSRRMRDAGALVHAVDVAANALKILKESNYERIIPCHDGMPITKLPDETYDIVVCLDLIGEFHRDDYRLFMAELARLVKPGGYVICSTPVDIDSEDALQKFTELTHTEFNIDKWIYSYHAFYLRLKQFLEAPSRFIEAQRNQSYRGEELERLKGFSHWWFKCNSTSMLSLLWRPIAFICKPIIRFTTQNRAFFLQLEKACRFFNDINGISHAMFIGRRRPLEIPAVTPVERPKKREIWE